ncbi:hypothetical protein EVAR_45397_1 [Eumeta japonica]|uniref:Uncharacterized protein n=1 Tax=Eumeta variegata TaxID=151549 RepID=A0A4C1WU10_EUMVA|nr:hypothetical protein EVAR_45397_1 [Eumeta japonica]
MDHVLFGVGQPDSNRRANGRPTFDGWDYPKIMSARTGIAFIPNVAAAGLPYRIKRSSRKMCMSVPCKSYQVRIQGQIYHMAFWASAQGPVDSRGPRLSHCGCKLKDDRAGCGAAGGASWSGRQLCGGAADSPVISELIGCVIIRGDHDTAAITADY